ncbi:hypothetical protein Xoosp13_245 [Xanthomonas phage Xoo-sp13]|nr:hypothetical protein Xoosp13_245 [Xanthomonas phage Xoo-sp13]
MNKLTVVILAALLFITALVGLTAVVSYVSYDNYGVSTEESLKAKLTDNQQMLGKHSTQIAEMAQVNTMYRDDLKEVYAAAMQGRYGENGSGAVMQWIKEQNPNLDPTLYTRLSQRIEANREEFTNSQRELIDQKRAYTTQLKRLWSGFWLSKVNDFPRIDLDEIKVITSTHSNKAYATGVDDGIQIRK